MPPPRDAQGLSVAAMRVIFTGTYRWLLAVSLRLGLTPNQLTALAVVTNVGVVIALVADAFLVAGVLIAFAGTFDVLDGAVARHRGIAGRAGAFTDSFLDRACDAMVFGALTWTLAVDGDGLRAGLALVTLVVSTLVSHVRAEAEAVGVRLTDGLFQRMERAIALVLGLMIPGALLPALVLLAVLGGATALQRAWMAVRRAPAEA